MNKPPSILFLPPHKDSPLQLWGMVELREGIKTETHGMTFKQMSMKIESIKTYRAEQEPK